MQLILRVIKSSLVSLSFFLLAGNVQAQLYPVQSTAQLIPPYSVYLSDYATPGAEKLRVILVQRDLTQPSYLLRLVLTVELNGTVILRTARTFNPAPISLNPGIPTIISGADLAPYLDSRNIDFVGFSREQYERTKALPEGSYQITFTAYDYHRQDVQVSNAGSSFYYLSKNEPPLINMPACGTQIPMRTPQQIVFTWLPRNTASPNSAAETQYEFALYETRPVGRNPNDVVLSTAPVFKTTVDFPQLVYGPAEPLLLENMKYVWRVRAVDINGRDAFRNNGYSEVCTFTYGGVDPTFNIGVVKGIQAEGETERRARIWWTAGDFDAYRVNYKKSGTSYEWFTSDVTKDQLTKDAKTDGEVKLFDLEPDTEYETRIQGKKSGILGDYTDIIKFRTKPMRVAVCGDAVALPPTPGNPFRSAIKGMLIKVDDMELMLSDVTHLGDGYYSGTGRVSIPYLGGASFSVKFSRLFIDENRVAGLGRIDFITKGVAAMMDEQLANQQKRQEEKVQQANRDAWAGTDFYDKIFVYDQIDIATITPGGASLVNITDTNGTVTANAEVMQVLTNAPTKAIIIQDKSGDQFVVQKNKDGVVTVTKVEGGGLLVGNDGKMLSEKSIRQLRRMIFAALKKYQKAIDAYEASIKTTDKKGGKQEFVVFDLSLFVADLPPCLEAYKDRLDEIKTELEPLADSASTAFTNFSTIVSKKIKDVNTINNDIVEPLVCETLTEALSKDDYASRLMSELEEIFNDDKRIVINNQLSEKCPDLNTHLQPETAKINNVPATLDTKIYVLGDQNKDLVEMHAELEKLPSNNVRVFIVMITDTKVLGMLNSRITDENLKGLEKYYSIERDVTNGNECAVAEQLIKDFLKDYVTVLGNYYNNLNAQFPNKICKNVSLKVSPNTLNNGVYKDSGLEDYAGLPADVRKEITSYLKEFSAAYGHSIKTYFTAKNTIDASNTEGLSSFERIRGNFDNGKFDDASYGIWLHYDDNSGCIYIRHGLNESKVFQESRKSKLTKPSDKTQIIADAKKTIDDVVSQLDSKGFEWSALGDNFKSIWKATVGGVSTVYDMGRETYETGQTPERLWNDTKSDQYTASPFHDPTNGIGAGGGDAIVAKVAEIPQLVSFGYSIATKEEVRTQLINTVKQVSWPKIQSAATDFFKEKKDKYTNGGNVTMHEASMDAGSVLLELLAGEKILDILKDMLKKLGKEAREAVVKAIKDKLTDPDQIKRLILDIDGSDKMLDVVSKNTDLIDAWKKLDNAGLDALRKNTDALKYIDDLKTPKLGIAKAPGLDDYNPRFKKYFPEIADDVHQVHHAVPQAVYKNFPGRITEAELHSIENLRGIPKSSPSFHQTITNKWAKFYTDFPNFTKQDALNFAKKIDDEFGHLFIPPIR